MVYKYKRFQNLLFNLIFNNPLSLFENLASSRDLLTFKVNFKCVIDAI